MDRSISVSTDVFAKIWSLRNEGEETEDAILSRVLSTIVRRSISNARKSSTQTTSPFDRNRRSGRSEVTWRDDVRTALERLNGRASLSRIYREVRDIRQTNGRSIPISFEPVVRRTLEENSSDSEVYRGGPDLFYPPEGKGAGVWALR